MKTQRREFLSKVGTASVGLSLFPTIVKASALGREGHIPPSDRINMILIGCGGMGRGNLNQFVKYNDVQAIAVCDMDDNQATRAKKIIDENYGHSSCRVSHQVIVQEGTLELEIGFQPLNSN